MSKAVFYDHNGKRQEVTLDATIYREANDANCSVATLLERKYSTDAKKYGSVIEQLAASSGLILHPDVAGGLRGPTLKDVFDGTAGVQAAGGVVTRDPTPASRILFPAVYLQWIENALVKDYTTQPNVFESMIALSETIDGPRYEQPVVDFTNPSQARHQAIAQNSLPGTMMVITASDVARKIPTISLGVQISDEALKATTLPFLTLSLTRQAAVERDARVEGYINAMVSGDTDHGQAALPATMASTYDAAATGGTFTQKAWVKWLFNNFRYRHISHVIMDIDTALKVEGRQGKPVVTTDDPNSPRIDATFTLLNNKLDTPIKAFIVDTGIVPANTIVGIDSRYAIRRVRNSQAEYQAAEQWVLQKSQAMRFDFGEVVYRFFDQAWDVLQIQ